MKKNNSLLFVAKLFSMTSKLIVLVLSISGFIPKHATVFRTLTMAIAVFGSIQLINAPVVNPYPAIGYFLVSTFAYIGFLWLVLRQHGLRLQFMKFFGGEQPGYLAYEAVLAFLFFCNGSALGYVCVAFEDTMPFKVDSNLVRPVASVLFIIGWTVKIWAARVVGVDIYYWKDMFLGRKICPFVVQGPYRFISNPMYGIGQLQAYATAIWYQSLPGLMAALLYQLLVFLFYFIHEKKFIARIYLNPLPHYLASLHENPQLQAKTA